MYTPANQKAVFLNLRRYTVEEFGHTVFDGAIALADPEGWKAVQMAESNAKATSMHTWDPGWDCHTAATEYVAAGVELVLYNNRIGESHTAKTAAELVQNDPNRFCLVAHWYEVGNSFKLCNDGPAIANLTSLAGVDCKSKLTSLGVTTFPAPSSNAGWGCVNKLHSLDPSAA
jgi:hypothetical protein